VHDHLHACLPLSAWFAHKHTRMATGMLPPSNMELFPSPACFLIIAGGISSEIMPTEGPAAETTDAAGAAMTAHPELGPTSTMHHPIGRQPRSAFERKHCHCIVEVARQTCLGSAHLGTVSAPALLRLVGSATWRPIHTVLSWVVQTRRDMHARQKKLATPLVGNPQVLCCSAAQARRCWRCSRRWRRRRPGRWPQ